MTDAKLTVELLDDLSEEAEDNPLVEVGSVTLSLLIAAARASLDLQAYDELRRGGISVGAAQQAWHMAHAACGALGLIYEETAPADIAAAVYAESAPSAPSQPAGSPWVAFTPELAESLDDGAVAWLVVAGTVQDQTWTWYHRHGLCPAWHFDENRLLANEVSHISLAQPPRFEDPTNGR